MFHYRPIVLSGTPAMIPRSHGWPVRRRFRSVRTYTAACNDKELFEFGLNDRGVIF